MIHALSLNVQGHIMVNDIQIYPSASYLVTVSSERLAPVQATVRRIEQGRIKGASLTPDMLLYLLLDQVVAGYYAILEHLDERIDDLQDRVLERPERSVQRELADVKRDLVTLRRAAAPLREMVNQTMAHQYPYLGKKTRSYLRDIHNSLIGVYDLLDPLRDVLGSVLDTYLSSVSNNTNEVMRRLTVISTMFLPMSVVTGFFGQNLTQLPFEQTWFFWLMIISLLGVPAAMLFWLRSRGWT